MCNDVIVYSDRIVSWVNLRLPSDLEGDQVKYIIHGVLHLL